MIALQAAPGQDGARAVNPACLPHQPKGSFGQRAARDMLLPDRLQIEAPQVPRDELAVIWDLVAAIDVSS